MEEEDMRVYRDCSKEEMGKTEKEWAKNQYKRREKKKNNNNKGGGRGGFNNCQETGEHAKILTYPNVTYNPVPSSSFN